MSGSAQDGGFAAAVGDHRVAASLLQHSRDALALVNVPGGDAEPRLTYVNAAFSDLTGYRADAVLGGGLRRFEATGTDADEVARLRAAVASGQPASGVVLIATADGSRRWVDGDVVPLSDEHGRPTLVAVVLRDATHRVRREALLALAGGQPCDLLAVTDTAGRVAALEPPERAVLGHERAELPAGGLVELAHDADVGKLRAALAEPASAGWLLVRLRHADGSWRWLEAHVHDRRGDPRVAGVVVAARDTSRREHARTELARTTQQLRMAVDLAQLGTWQLDLSEATVAEDAVMGEGLLLDLDGPPMTLEQSLAYVHDDDRECFRAAITDAVARAGSLEHTFRVVDSEGVWRRLLARAQVACDPDGTPTHVNGITMEVAEPDAGGDLGRTLEDAIDACWVLDDRWRVRYVNARGEQVLGHGRDELIGQPLSAALPEATARVIDRSCHEATGSGHAIEFPVFLAATDCWYQVRVAPSDGELFVWLHDITEQMHGEAQQRRLIASERSARRAAASAEAELADASARDALTGLLSRAELERRLRALLADYSAAVAVLFIDLDGFRMLNNSLGHTMSDTVLRNVAARISEGAGSGTLAARFGGDKFVVALERAGLDDALAVADRLRSAIHEPYDVDERQVVMTTSIGVATATTDDTAEVVLRNADAAVAAAKRAGRGHVTVFDDSLHVEALRLLDTESDLRATTHGEQLKLDYQPLFDLADGRRLGAEALLRWHHPTRGLLQPGAFIGVAEGSGLIVPMGTWVIDQASRAVAQHRADGPGPTAWVNVAAPQLLRPEFADELAEAQRRHGLDAGELGIELTERTLLTNHETINVQLRQLHGQGVRIAIDDFGTGYSSMSLLQQSPIDMLKIDQVFTANHHSRDGDAIIRAIVQLAHALGATACAEGVETREQLAAVRAAGCDSATGYLLGYPQEGPLPQRTDL